MKQTETGVVDIFLGRLSQCHLQLQSSASERKEEDAQQQLNTTDSREGFVDEAEVIVEHSRTDERRQSDDGEDEVEVRLEGNREFSSEA